MPTAVIETLPVSGTRKVWTRAECDVIEKTGIFDWQHLELVEGDLINKMGKNRPHVNSLAELVDCLVQIFGRHFVNQEAPIDVAPEDNPTNEPEADVIVLNRDRRTFSGNPGPRDLCLVAEVADTSLYIDLKIKAALYARAGIIEYWVLDVNAKRLIVHRDPQNGRYSSIVAYSEDESVAPLAAPNSLFHVRDAFPA